MTDNRTTEFIDEPDTIRNEAMDDGLLMTDNRMTELRKKLMEHGIKYEARDNEKLCATLWISHGTQWIYRVFDLQSSLSMCSPWLGCTPEQAIAATMGSGTCEIIGDYYSDEDYMLKLSCGDSVHWPAPNYCPSCGRQIGKAVE